MKIWLDAQLSPAIAKWLNANFAVSAVAIRDLGLHGATDRKIFNEAKTATVVIMTKDSDFVRLLEELGPPPQIIWLTFGNTSNANLKKILAQTFTQVLMLLQNGEPLVEISAI